MLHQIRWMSFALVLKLVFASVIVAAEVKNTLEEPKANEAVLQINCPEQLIVYLPANACEVFVDIPPPVSDDDDCPIIFLENNLTGNMDPSGEYGLGSFNLVWTVEDDCGNTSECVQTIDVVDNVSPNLNCRSDLEISVSNGIGVFPGNILVSGVSDNCSDSTDIDIQARRMLAACQPGSDEFDINFFVCCDDVGTEVSIVVRVTDEEGNTQECMTTVSVVDKIAPHISEQLPDISVSCELNFDLDELAELFGKIVFDESEREEIIIVDHFYLPDGFVGLDGLASDNCPTNLTVTESVEDNLHINQGEIIRTFVVTDGSGNSATSSQIITVVEIDPFDDSDIAWPEHLEIMECIPPVPSPEMAGSPVLNFKKCALVTSDYQDWIYTVPNSGCHFVERKWKVIDWVQRNPLTGEGIWEYTQFITQVNSVEPVFTSSCEDITICADESTCLGHINLTASATDDCTNANMLSWTYQFDADNDGTVNQSGNTESFLGVFDQGTHRITWVVNDGCNNTASCSYLINIRDCKAPLPICYQGLSTDVTSMCESRVPASMFNHQSYDNCTSSSDLIFSFSDNVNDTIRIYTCDSLGVRPVSMWATDSARNQSRCNTFISVTDLSNSCEEDDDQGRVARLFGKIMTPEENIIENVEVSIIGAEVSEKYMTDSTGIYAFTDLPLYNDYIVRPDKDTDWNEGVSTMDLVQIQRHILGINKLDSPYQMIAADVNNSNSVSAADLVELRRLILGIQEKFQNNKSWRFIDSTLDFEDAEFPWPFNESIEYQSLDSDMMDVDFYAVKIGDVNGSVNNIRTGVDSRHQRQFELYTENYLVEEDEIVEIEIKAGSALDMLAIQFTLAFDVMAIELINVDCKLPGFNEELHTALHSRDERNLMTFAYHDVYPLSVFPDFELVKLRFRVLKRTHLSEVINLNSQITNAKVYDELGLQYQTVLKFRNLQDDYFNISQNRPNPFKDFTEFDLKLDKNVPVDIVIFNSSGSVLHQERIPARKGMNTYRVSERMLNGVSGVFFVRFQVGDENIVRKILRLE
jgi:hypothetical protein